MKIIEIGLALLNRKNELVISAFTSSAANKISRNTVHTFIRVNTWVRKNYMLKVYI